MKTELKITAMRIAFFAALVAAAYFLAGCKSPAKMRDIELKGMYVNGYSETLALGAGRITSIPGEREALAAHYEEDTAWLQPNIKTHKIDIFMVGKNSSANSPAVIEQICKAFAEVAPTVAKEDAETAKSIQADTPLGVVKAGGDVRKAVELAKVAAGKASGNGTSAASASSDPHAAECADGSCTTGDCSDGSCTPEVK
jgi:hypothetical protein